MSILIPCCEEYNIYVRQTVFVIDQNKNSLLVNNSRVTYKIVYQVFHQDTWLQYIQRQFHFTKDFANLVFTKISAAIGIGKFMSRNSQNSRKCCEHIEGYL